MVNSSFMSYFQKLQNRMPIGHWSLTCKMSIQKKKRSTVKLKAYSNAAFISNSTTY